MPAPPTTRHRRYWCEIDLTYYGLVALSWLGVIHDLRPVPAHALTRDRLDGVTAGA